jgi:hypothetical protein
VMSVMGVQVPHLPPLKFFNNIKLGETLWKLDLKTTK